MTRFSTMKVPPTASSADDYQGHLDDAAEVTQAHRDAIVRHRRAMLDLNTAVGLRVLP